MAKVTVIINGKEHEIDSAHLEKAKNAMGAVEKE